MRLPFTRSYFRARKRAGIRSSMRGYRMLETSGHMDLLVKLRDDITNTPLLAENYRAVPFFFGAASPKAELVLRQFLVSRLLNLSFNGKILRALSRKDARVNYPMPREWRKLLEQKGFRADTFFNTIIWNGFTGYMMLQGWIVTFRICLENIGSMFSSHRPQGDDSYVYFHSLTRKNLPHKNVPVSYDIITWYSRRRERTNGIDLYLHDAAGALPTMADGKQVEYRKHSIPLLHTPAKVGRFMLWAIQAASLAFFDFLRGRYWHAVLLREAARSAVARFQDPGKLAKDYLFHNAYWIYRPLWTYEAESKGSVIIFYFYSTNVESLKKIDGYGLQAYSWQIINWPTYLVWDVYQADFIRRAIGEHPGICVVGPVWFSSGSMDRVDIPENGVAVFDINPLRDARYHLFGESPAYLVPGVINRFLEDIYTVLSENELVMVLKRKRDIGNILNKRYKHTIDRLAASGSFQMADMDTQALFLIEDSRMSISLPFTSTALIAREIGKPACYYDASGIIQSDDRAAHGIEIISGIDALRTWVLSIIDNSVTYTANSNTL
jgi:polysaccharide biosynthesis PFTS motif protein